MMVQLGLRGRLFLAFAAVGTLTVAATAVGWIALVRLGNSLDQMVVGNIPALTAAARLAEKGGVVIGTAPALAASADEADRAHAWDVLRQSLRQMDEAVDGLVQRVSSAPARLELVDVVAALAGNLRDLDETVRRRLWFQNEKEHLSERLRWASADFIDEVEPMIDDTRFNIGLALEPGDGGAGAAPGLAAEIGKQGALQRLNANGSLLAELIGRAANLPTSESLRTTELYLLGVKDGLRGDLAAIRELPGVLSLVQSLEDILAFADGEQSIFRLRADELLNVQRGQALLEENRELVDRLHDLIRERVRLENATTLGAAEAARGFIGRSKTLLAATVLASLASALLIVWLYVGRSIVRRVTRLDGAMRAIADGDLRADVPVGGTDEIGDMAVSLRTFRDTLSQTQAELLQTAKLAALGQLTAGVAHEVNQPLAAIRHYAHNAGILMDKGRHEEAKANLERIAGLVEKANRIIENLRSLARKPQKKLRTVDLVPVVEDTLVLLERRIRQAGVEVEVCVDQGYRHVIGGQVRLEQVLLNLLSNALDAMESVETRRLEIGTRGVDGWVELRVRDTGRGISEEDLVKVFDPFFTTKDVGEGLGLGLSISYNIIKGLGGSMRVESRPGETLFLVLLESA